MPTQFTFENYFHEQAADKISNVAQVGGIETSVIDNGAGRGTRIAWINTGSGLRYKVVIDRAMDIADTFYNRHSIAWLSNKGVSSPQPFSDKGADWLRTFTGGLLTTCGLSHVGGPEKDEFGERGLHGLISNSPAEIESIIQPDPWRNAMEMSITGIIRETRIFGPSLQLKRTVSSILGTPVIRIHDEVTNCGNQPVPHMLLYHFNFGWPLIDEGARLLWTGRMFVREGKNTDSILNEHNDDKICPPPLDEHRGAGEAVAFIDLDGKDNGECACGIENKKLNLAVKMTFNKKQLPWFTNWQHWGRREYLTGLEPGTHPPIGQSAARKENTLIFLQPGETRNYDVRLEIRDSINQLTDTNGK